VLAYAAAFGSLGIGGGPFIAGQMGPLLGLRSFFALNSVLLLLGFVLWLRALTAGASADPRREAQR
jgi:MFS family permease